MAVPADLNIENTTYPHDELRKNWFLLDQLLNRMAPVFSINNPTSPGRELGALTVLPSELLLDIFENLSIIDLMRFRLCNRSSSYFVNTIPPLRTALRIAPNTIKGMMALQVSTHITARELCRKIYQRECDACGRLAQGIYLPTCLRACFICMKPGVFGTSIPGDEILDESLSVATAEQLASVPSFRPLLGTFTNGVNKFKMVKRHVMYDNPDNELMDRLGWRRWYYYPYNPSEAASDSLRGGLWRQRGPLESNMPWPLPDEAAVTVVRDPLHPRLHMYMTVVIAPWPDSTASRAEQGIFCSACWCTKNGRLLHTRDTFLEHLKDCRVGPYNIVHFEYTRKPRIWLCEDTE